MLKNKVYILDKKYGIWEQGILLLYRLFNNNVVLKVRSKGNWYKFDLTPNLDVFVSVKDTVEKESGKNFDSFLYKPGIDRKHNRDIFKMVFGEEYDHIS